MTNKLKTITLTDKQKKYLNLFALIFTGATMLGAGIWFVVYNTIIKPNAEFTPQVFISYILTYGGLVLLIWKIILTLIHTKKVKNFGEQERNFISMNNKKHKTKIVIDNFKSHGFEFVENKNEVVIKINKEFTSKDIFITSFKAATLEYCDKVRKSMEK